MAAVGQPGGNPTAITGKLCITTRNIWNWAGDAGETPGPELQIIPCLQEELAQALLPEWPCTHQSPAQNRITTTTGAGDDPLLLEIACVCSRQTPAWTKESPATP